MKNVSYTVHTMVIVFLAAGAFTYVVNRPEPFTAADTQQMNTVQEAAILHQKNTPQGAEASMRRQETKPVPVLTTTPTGPSDYVLVAIAICICAGAYGTAHCMKHNAAS